jgi:membrane protease YdiL (CAAX protease family)
MKNALIYTIVFAAIQVVVSMLVQGVWMLVMGKESAMNATGMIITMAVFSVLTMVVFLWAKWSVVSRHWVRTRPWFVLFWCVLAALGALIPSVWIQEHMPELPNIVEGEFDMIMKDRWGYLVVGLLAPLAEEMVFRGAVLRSLLRWKENPWIGIVISAVLFAVIHMNPAQMPHAFLIGLLLGWLYYRTDSIVPGVVYHWVNNTVAYVMYNLYPNPDLTLVELFGTEQKVLMALGCSLLIFLPSLFQLNQRLNK